MIPFVLLGIGRLRTILNSVSAVSYVVVRMWLERYIIVVPTLENPRLAAATFLYAPTSIEIAITAATFGAATMLYMLS